MKLVQVTLKTLKETVRQPKGLALTLGLPVAFMLIFGLAFGGAESNRTYALRVVDLDEGEMGARYVDGLRNLTYEDGTPIFRVVEEADEASAREALRDRKAAMLVRIPANFSAGLAWGAPPQGSGLPVVGGPGGPPTPPPGTTVALLGDPSWPPFTVASQVVAVYSREFGEAATRTRAPLATETELVTSDELNEFDFIAPGLMVFAILNLAPQAAAVLARETELRTLDRVRLSPLRSWELLAGVALAQLVMSGVSLTLMLATAKLMGFNNQGTYLAAFVIALGAAFAVVGLGMMIASFAKTQQEAANIGTMVAVPASFLSGAFFAIPGVKLFDWGGRAIGLYDLLPTTHAVAAMRAVMTYGGTLGSVAFSLGAIALLGLAFFAAGVALYGARRLAPE